MLSCGHRTHRVAGLAVTLLALLAFPAAASAAESVHVDGGTLAYANTAGDADHVTVSSGGTTYPGKYVVSEPNTPTANAGAGCSQLALGTALCGGWVWYLSVNTAAGADRVTVDADLASSVYGYADDDALTGGTKADYIFGGDGNDTLYGRGGGDWLRGEDGDDVIEARDGRSDVVICGPGADTAYVDPGEGTLECETVIADSTPSPVFTPPVEQLPVDDRLAGPKDGVDTDELTDAFDPDVIPTLDGPLQIASPVIAVSAKGVATFDLVCAPTETAGCRGSVFLDPVLANGKAKSRAKGKARRTKVRAVASRRGRFGHSKFVVAAGKRKKLAVDLSGAARKALGLTRSGKAHAARRGRAVRARVTIVQTGRRAQTTVVTLRG